jgi:hypothetical protein
VPGDASQSHWPSGALQAFFGWGASYGNAEPRVGGLWPHGVIVAGPGFVDRHGQVGLSFVTFVIKKGG